MQNSTYPTYQKYYFKSFRSTLSGIFALWAHLGRLYPLQHTESIQIVGQIPQPNLRLRPDQPNRSDDQVPRSHRLHPKDMFHPTPNPRSRPIPLLLPLRQLLMLTSLALKMLPISTLPQLLQLLLRTIRRIRPHVSTAVILIQKRLKNLTVMNRRRRHLIVSNQLMLHIDINVILVTVIILTILLSPSGIGILLAFLLLAPILRNLSRLDLSVFFPAIALPGSLNNAGVDNLPSPGRKSFLFQKVIKFLKQPLDHPGLRQLLPEQPDGLLIRNRISQGRVPETS